MNDIQPTHHVANNVHISRTIEGATQIILVDTTPPTQGLNLKHANLQVDQAFDGPNDQVFKRCLVLEFDNGVDAYAISKVAEHLTPVMTTLPRRATICLNPSKSSETSSTATPSDGGSLASFRCGANSQRSSACCPTPIRRSSTGASKHGRLQFIVWTSVSLASQRA